MKNKLFILIISVMLFPSVVRADGYCANESNKAYCTGTSCLTDLQQTYNTWNATGNTGRNCIRVIAQRKGSTKTYFRGKNPEQDYKCSNGNTPTAELKASGLADAEVSACQSETCYVPELWTMNCGDANTSNSSNSSANNSTNGTTNSSGTNSSSTNSSGSANSSNSNVGTNSEGQITGTTESKDTGVETYFIVLLSMTIVAYLILVVSKKKNLFKNI